MQAPRLEDYYERLQILEEFLVAQKAWGFMRGDVDIQSLSLGISALFRTRDQPKPRDFKQAEKALMDTINIMYSSPVQAATAAN